MIVVYHKENNISATTMARTSCISLRWWCLLCTIHDINVSWNVISIAHWNNSLWVDMSLRSVTLSRFGANQSLFLLFNTARKETSNTNSKRGPSWSYGSWIYSYLYNLYLLSLMLCSKGGRRDRMVVEFTATCTICTYYH